MNHSVRGSTWNKWDFHIHTPYSILNNGYKFNPDDEDEASFDEYVKQLFTRAINSNTAAIGITDYFSIDGYKRIRTKYLDAPEKMVELFPDEEFRKRIMSIYVFPNIEFRLDTFVGNHSVNYHVIFSDEVPILNIEENFLQRLTVPFHDGSNLKLTRNSIEIVGADYRRCNPREGTDYEIGLEKVTVKYEEIAKTLKNGFPPDNYMITIPVDEDLSKVKWNGRDYSTRRVLYQQCHCLLTSNNNTREWALAKGREEQQKQEFGSIKPCIWGSDAHSYDRMFAPDRNRFCWIKSELSFSGLRQILYEPEDRVRIQEKIPYETNPHQVIDYIQFDHPDFQTEPVYFSEWLTCIIGGKSTGKSILLRHIANSISPSTVRKMESKMRSNPRKLVVTASVIWKDGSSGERKILYIPQSWLNQAVDEKQSDSPLNKLIEDVLIENETIKPAYVKLQDEITEIVEKTRHYIKEYVSCIEKAREAERLLQKEGRSESFQATIEKLERQRQELTVSAGITPEKIERYAILESRLSDLSKSRTAITGEQKKLEGTKLPTVYIPGITTVFSNGDAEYDFNDFTIAKEEVTEAVKKVDKAIRELWFKERETIASIYTTKLSGIDTEERNIMDEYIPLKETIAVNDQLTSIEESLKYERKKLQVAIEREKAKQKSTSRANELKKLILLSICNIREAYIRYKEVVEKLNAEGTDLTFNAEIEIKKESFLSAINSLFDNRGFRAFSTVYHYDLLNPDTCKVDDNLFDKIWEAMISSISERGSLSLKGGNTLQTALESLFKDWYFVHYIIKSENDTLSDMSPGKKALVLLEMLITLEKGNCPILIDQPEDDLDNRSIYSDLVRYLRQKKYERQIIVVTHNANVVVGADAEEVIIANQTGKDTANHSRRFEYRSGAIENNDPVAKDGKIVDGVLNQKGLQEQICDILEGGKHAFEARRNKYSFPER